ncbi:MAG: pyruvate kinase [candidate division SR1 bacterium]|nr:pyruvate kinase [candidate division SR1 bacterium]
MTGIIATLGPASANKDMLIKLHQAGVTIFRFNFAHESFESATKTMSLIREIEKEGGVKIHTLLDAEGPGIRTGVLKTNIDYKTGEQFKIYVDGKQHESKSLLCDYIHLPDDVKVGGIMKIDAGLFKVKILETHPEYISVEAQNDFSVGSRRHINLPGVHVHLPSFTDKDKKDVLFAIQSNFDFVALSFVRSADDMIELRKFLNDNGGSHIKTIAKIENEEGITNVSEIAAASDMIMVARGDLGTELPIENIPLYQIEIIQKTKLQNKKVIVATEMLESMIHNPSPTRAEVNDVFYAEIEGADYVMLSGETAVGEHPVECVDMMKKIIDSAEKYM